MLYSLSEHDTLNYPKLVINSATKVKITLITPLKFPILPPNPPLHTLQDTKLLSLSTNISEPKKPFDKTNHTATSTREKKKGITPTAPALQKKGAKKRNLN